MLIGSVSGLIPCVFSSFPVSCGDSKVGQPCSYCTVVLCQAVPQSHFYSALFKQLYWGIIYMPYNSSIGRIPVIFSMFIDTATKTSQFRIFFF